MGTLLGAVTERRPWVLRRPSAALTDDSRRSTSGDCFVAVRGARVDGRRFIPQAVERGARAVVAEPPDPLPGEAVGRILVPDSRRALPWLADAYFGHPSRALTVVGITGTNGKTTTSYLVRGAPPRPRSRDGRGRHDPVHRARRWRAPRGRPRPRRSSSRGSWPRWWRRGSAGRGHGGVVPRPRAAARRRRRVRRGRVHEPHAGPPRLPRHDGGYAAAKGRLFFELLPTGRKPGAAAVLNADDPVGAEMGTRRSRRPRADLRARRPGHATGRSSASRRSAASG